MIDICPADYVEYRRVAGAKETVNIVTLVKCGLEILDSSLCGVKSVS